MCIYCGTKHYRKIYENHHGVIPRDETGKSYHIHHKDGERANNSPDNLVALSIQEHYDVHYNQYDWAACHRLGKLLNKSASEISSLSSEAQQSRISDGTHHFLSKNRKDCDLTVYKWQNIITNEVIEATCQQMSSKFTESRIQFTPIIRGERETAGNWRLYSDVPYVNRKLLMSGEKNPAYNHTIYKWENVKTDEIFEGTCWEMSMKAKGHYESGFTSVARGKKIKYAGWRLYSCDKHNKSETHRRYNHTVYKWQNIHTLEILEGTMNDMQKHTGISSTKFSALVNGRGKTRNGWRLLKSENNE